jgi:competence protein ComFC
LGKEEGTAEVNFSLGDTVFRGLLDLVFPREPLGTDLPDIGPHLCSRCGEGYDGDLNGDFRCSNCAGRRWYISRARAAYRAQGEVRELIHELKYNQQFHHLPQLSRWLEEGFRRFYMEPQDRWDGLVPVPLYPVRRRERGFNQAGELARLLGKRTGLVVWDVLERTRQTEVQARLRRSERLRNQLNAFGLKRGFDLQGKRLLIIDDVFTTGATINACAQVLKKAGAQHLAALTVARG